MEKAFSKKQYVILLVVSAVLAIVLPMACHIYAKYSVGDSTGMSISSYVESLFQVAAYAIFVFVCLRCRFAWCLPFLAVLFVGLCYGIDFNEIWIVVMPLTALFVLLGIIKLCGKLIKNELIAASVALVLVYILDRAFLAADMAVLYLKIRLFSAKIITSYISDTVTPFWKPILSVFCIFLTYFIIRQIFRRTTPVAPAAPEAIRG